MPVRIRYHINIQISSTTAEEKDLANASLEVVTDSFGEGGVRKFTVIAGATDLQIGLDNVANTQFLAIRTNSKDPTLDPVQLSVKRNTTGNEAIPITPMPTTKEGHLLISTTGLTALFVSNAGAVDMELTAYNCGD